MKVIQIIKKVNNTEIGAGSTHETYILVTQGLKVEDIFEEKEKEYSFVDKVSKIEYPIRLSVGNERRIVGLGRFYRDSNISAGDEVLLEKREVGSSFQYFISLQKDYSKIVLLKKGRGFEILTPERMSLLNDDTTVNWYGNNQKLSIVFRESRKKRIDSPIETKFFDVIIGNHTINSNYNNNELLEIEFDNNVARIPQICAWQKYIFTTEE